MMIIRLYNSVIAKVKQIVPKEHAYRKRNLAWLITGMFHGRSVHLSKIANRIPSDSRRESLVRRLSRFFQNPQVRVRLWYEPVARELLEAAAQAGDIRLIVDGSKVAFEHQLLMVALAYRRRALPIAWTWVRGPKGHSSAWKQQALLEYVHQLIPEQATVILTGDSEFTPLQEVAIKWGWFYALRHKGSHLYRSHPKGAWQQVASLVTMAGQQVWLENIELTKGHQHHCHFFAYWQRGEKEPWLIATNLPTAQKTRLHYSRRMWIEEMFGDFKGHGVDLEKSHLRHFQRLSRLTLAVSLLYIWLVAFGSAQIKNGKRSLVDRTDRRDLSIYRIGHDLLIRYLVNEKTFTIPAIPYF
jgi:hypothetical protein